MRIFRKETTESTNLDARVGSPGDVFVAEFQTAGRGRLDHRWHSAKGENLTFSVVLAARHAAPAEVATLPLVVGLALAESLGSLLDGRGKTSLKWPNDILVDGRKICGILCERSGDRVIAGIGVNVNQVAFPIEIAARATSLAAMSGGRTFDRDRVLRCILEAIRVRHGQWLAGGFAALHPAFAAIDCLKERSISVYQTDSDPAPLVGFCDGIQTDGTLLVGGVRVFAGEAHIVLETGEGKL